MALGIEGSANKVGVGVLIYNPTRSSSEGGEGVCGEYVIAANPRKTFITPAGQVSE